MKKRYRNMQKKANGKVREISNGSVLLELPLSMAGVIESLPEVIRALAQEAGLLLMSAAMNAECEMIAGHKNSKNPLRAANWWGGDLGPVYYDKQKVLIDRPRLRSKNNKEIPLATYQAFGDPRGMRNSVIKNMILGISSRNYAESVESFLKGYGIKKSSVSRHFVKATAEQMREFMERDLAGLDLVAIFIDGIAFKGHLIVVALGLDKGGAKHVLGLWQGATENAIVVKGLLEDLVERGVTPEHRRLFVIDGSKALRQAIDAVFGADNPVQRCRNHKVENVMGHLPEHLKEQVKATMKAAYRLGADEGIKRLKLQAEWLQHEYPSAAASLREGLEETFTISRLNLTPSLRRCLATTNLIESPGSGVRLRTGRVTNWKSGSMVLRWTATAYLETEQKFRKLMGYRDLWMLQAALKDQSERQEQELAA